MLERDVHAHTGASFQLLGVDMYIHTCTTPYPNPTPVAGLVGGSEDIPGYWRNTER